MGEAGRLRGCKARKLETEEDAPHPHTQLSSLKTPPFFPSACVSCFQVLNLFLAILLSNLDIMDDEDEDEDLVRPGGRER